MTNADEAPTPLIPEAPAWQFAPTVAAPSRGTRVTRWLYLVTVLFIWDAAILVGLVTQSVPCQILTVAMLPLVLPAILMVGSCQTFGLAHSALGWHARTRIPREVATETRSAATQTYYFCPDGIGIHYLGLGDLYVPYHAIHEVGDPSFPCRIELSHSWPECRSPVKVPRAIGLLVRDALQDRSLLIPHP